MCRALAQAAGCPPDLGIPRAFVRTVVGLPDHVNHLGEGTIGDATEQSRIQAGFRGGRGHGFHSGERGISLLRCPGARAASPFRHCPGGSFGLGPGNADAGSYRKRDPYPVPITAFMQLAYSLFVGVQGIRRGPRSVEIVRIRTSVLEPGLRTLDSGRQGPRPGSAVRENAMNDSVRLCVGPFLI